MKRRWLYAGGALLGVLLLSSSLLVLSIGTTPEEACHTAMSRAEGYGPWHYQGRASAAARASKVILAYWDGFNTSHCSARALGPLWFVEPMVSETSAGCSLGIDKGMCPRARYGVVP
jgi:hypothetical protein